MDSVHLSDQLAAVASPQRMRILAALAAGEQHVSQIARQLGMSRPVLYMHLTKLADVGFIQGRLELSEDGKAFKYFQLLPFSLTVDISTVIAAVASLTAPAKDVP